MTQDFEIDREILVEFIKETLEELDGLDPQFIALEKNPHDTGVLNAIFRTMHSIKGSSSFFNLNHIRTFSHKLENLLDDLRKGAREADLEIINIMLEGKDQLEKMLNRLAAGNFSNEMEKSEEELLFAVEKILSQKPTVEKRQMPTQVFGEIDLVIPQLAESGLLDHSSVSELVTLVERLREMVLGQGGVDSRAPQLGEMLVSEGVVSSADVVGALSKQKKLGDILVEEGKVDRETIEKVGGKQKKIKEEINQASREKTSTVQAQLRKTMRIEEEKIDGFMDVVGELIINAEVFNYLQKKLEAGQDLEKSIMEFKNANLDFSELIFNLQKELAEVRKIPLKGIFQKLPRMVRDLAVGMKKKADIYLTGEKLLVDKSLFEQLESPLNHLIRNSVDHGIESPSERLAMGKAETGSVKVIATEGAGDFIIRIIDDGRGMNVGQIKAKAVEKGLISPENAATISDKDAYRMVFLPGFSTAKNVTDISGRGVGMDVVMTMINENKGKVDIISSPGVGTEIVISLPLSSTLITISGLVVALGTENYIIPMEWVRESINPDREQVISVKGEGELIRIREQLYPLIRLYEEFGAEPRFRNPWDGVVMVIEKDDAHCCVLVDEIIEETQVVLKDLGGLFRGIPEILGGAILGDGNVGLVVNVEGLIKSSGLTAQVD
ncbi:MAG: chemotaxis protein CheA [Nitrospinota bacterium]|nr:chemotaxis protein CheA [Nitrospinota bacterium]MDH5678213.1 chemotaxis protein CheA [Nitrospinota bacterium]